MLDSAVAKQSHYIPGIDGLRAIAVLFVILFHFDSSILQGGFTGVDVFFVISGYVVSSSLAREREQSFVSFSLNFYARRIVRIYPALVVCLVFFSALQTLIVPSSWLSSSSDETAKYAFFGLSNYALIWFNDGYFSPRVEFNLFTHTWSLAVEEQFYFLFPVVFFIWMKWSERKGLSGYIAKWLLAFLLIISLTFSWYATSTTPDNAYYLLPSRFWELACGAMLFKFHTRKKFVAWSEITASGCVLIGLVLVGMGFAFSDSKSFPFPWAMISVIGALFAIAGVASESGRKSTATQILDNRLMVYIGKASYSLYLWHWPVIVIFKWTIGIDTSWNLIEAITLTILASLISYHVIEKPIRRSNFVSSRSDFQIVAIGLALIVISFNFSVKMFDSQSWHTLSVTKDRWNWYPEEWPSSSDKSLLASKSLTGHKVFVLGDSHTGAYSTMLRKLADDQGVVIRKFSKAGCPVANLIRVSETDCATFTQQALSKIKEEALPGDIVFLASLRMNRLGDQWNIYNESEVLTKQNSSDSINQRSAALLEADKLISNFENASLIVILDTPKPIFKSPPFRCSDWFNASNPICDGGFTMERNLLLEHRKPVMASINKLIALHPKLSIWDPFPILCPSENCYAFDEKLPLFFDGDHLSAHGNRILYPSFLNLVANLWEQRIVNRN